MTLLNNLKCEPKKRLREFLILERERESLKGEKARENASQLHVCDVARRSLYSWELTAKISARKMTETNHGIIQVHPKVVDKNVDFASKVIPGSKGQLRKRKSRLILEHQINSKSEPLIIVAGDADQPENPKETIGASVVRSHGKPRFLPRQWMYAWRKNHKKKGHQTDGGKAKPRSSSKKGLFSKVAKMTRVLQAFKTKKVVHTSIVEEPTSVHLRPIQSSTSGLVCHFSKVNYRHPHVPVVIKSTCAATAAVCVCMYRVFPRDMENRTI